MNANNLKCKQPNYLFTNAYMYFSYFTFIFPGSPSEIEISFYKRDPANC